MPAAAAPATCTTRAMCPPGTPAAAVSARHPALAMCHEPAGHSARHRARPGTPAATAPGPPLS